MEAPLSGLLALDPYATDWLNLVARGLHVIAAIAWIGSSLYFIALDNHLERPKAERDADEGVAGEAWEIHGGGFYRVEKYQLAPRSLPERLLWFKWEAYVTWLSGFALLVVLYYLNADLYLLDRDVADIGPLAGTAISVGLLAASWAVYDVLCRLLRGHDLLLGACLVALTAASAYGIGQLFSERAVYVQVGAMLGTMMAGNVLLNIIPAHRGLIRAKEAGREPDAGPGLEAKRRSVHNNYLTLPVLFTMISNHFPFTYGHEHAWLILVVLMLIGAWIRHFFNLRHSGRTVWAIPATAALAIAGVAVAIRPEATAPPDATDAVPFSEVRRIVEQRCATCHAAEPTDRQFTVAPKGIAFDTPEQIRAQADAIEQQAVSTRSMPLGNLTRMTPAERERLGAWIRQGARIE
ncbi:MAG: urate hydroxylase PuuD [Gaiellaceae bacterium]